MKQSVIDKHMSVINEALELLSDFSKLKHLFSDDKPTRKMARLRETIGQIKLHLKFSELKTVAHPEDKPIREGMYDTGCLVKIRPCDEEKTYIGILIGDAALSSSVSIKDDAIVCNWAQYNPAIVVPELGRVVYGCQSWWGRIKDVSELEQISDDDINNVWYVKLFNKLNERVNQPQGD